MDNIKISYAEKWQAQHWKAIVSSYKNSPYFDYYEQDILNIYLNEYEKLMDLNKATQDAMNKIIGISPKIKLTEEFEVSPENDYRSLIHPKKEAIVPVPRYIQVFEEKHGYIENLSILDLIFNEGPMALVYLKNLKY